MTTTVAAARLVAAREIKVKLRDKTFLFSTAFFLLIAVASTVLPALIDGGPSSVAVTGGSASTASLQQAGLEVRTVASDADAERLDPAPGNPFVQFIVPFALAFIFFITSFTFGLLIAQSVTEEKQTRIVEILVASVPVRALLAGKVAAMTLLAFGQIALITLVAFVGMRLADLETGVVNLIGPAIGWFLPFFVLGFIMLAALWAGVGALAARQEDLAGTSSPLQMAVMLPFFATIFLSDNAAAMKVLSYIPLSAPVAMPIRLFNDEAAAWEPVVSLVLLALTAVALLAVGARLYEGSLLRTNGRTSFGTAWRSRTLVS
jgi:ABC-2 type transport system permease protein